MMRFLARRSYSELELRQKLAQYYDDAEVADAIAFAHEQNWIPSPHEMAEQVARELTRKRKGHRYIQNFLREKGLPTTARDGEAELARGRELVATKWPEYRQADRNEKIRISRFLANRGYDDETIRTIILGK